MPTESLEDSIKRLKIMLRIVRRNKNDLVDTLTDLQKDSKMKELFHFINKRTDQDELSIAIEEVTRKLQNFLTSAFALVDYTRRHRALISKDLEFSREIVRQINRRFKGEIDHLIAQRLRTVSVHYEIIPVNARFSLNTWEVPDNFESTDVTGRFLLKIDDLLEWEQWSEEEKAMLEDSEPKIDILEFVERYFSDIEDFYDWFLKRHEMLYPKSPQP